MLTMKTPTYCFSLNSQPCFVLLGFAGLRSERSNKKSIREDLGERILAYFDDDTILASLRRGLHPVRRFESHARSPPFGLRIASPRTACKTCRPMVRDHTLAPSSRGLALLGTTACACQSH